MLARVCVACGDKGFCPLRAHSSHSAEPGCVSKADMTIEPRESGFFLKRLAALSDFQRKKGNENGDDSDAGRDDKAYKCKHQRKLGGRSGPLKIFGAV
jgi:hypothetical protein